MVVKGRKSTKKPPVLSHEFIIQNHADIVSCVMVVFVLGMIVPLTSSICNIFVVPQYIVETAERTVVYGNGLKDICTVFFYSMVCIILHAVQQEYVLDKISKKLHLSKIKTSMFNESGQLLVFHLLSVVWAADLIIKEDLLVNIRSIWENYPHMTMPFMMKFFYIMQMAYYVHCYPELYFSKVKREDMPAKIKFATLCLLYISAAYALNFSRVGVLLLFLHYLSEGFYHMARLFDIVDKEEKNSKIAILVSDIVFALARVGTVILSLITFLVGLAKHDKSPDEAAEGALNNLIVRLSAFGLIVLLQAYLSFFFVKEHMQKMKENQVPTLVKQPSKKQDLRSAQKKKNAKNNSESELTEADQNLKRTIRARKAKSVK